MWFRNSSSDAGMSLGLEQRLVNKLSNLVKSFSIYVKEDIHKSQQILSLTCNIARQASIYVGCSR